jgi:hypothetical protein
METTNLGRGAAIAGISGALLFVFMFFHWYSVPGSAQADQLGAFLGNDISQPTTGFNAWQSFDFTDLICLLAVIVALGLAAMTLMGSSASLPVAGSALTCGAGALAFLFVLYRTLNPPGDGLDREIGVFLGLLATAGIAAGGYLGMQEEGTTFAEQAERLRG